MPATPRRRACSSNSRCGRGRAQEARAVSAQQVGDLRARPRQNTGSAGRPLRSNASTNSSAWLVSRADGARHSDTADVGAGVGQQAPEQRMRQAVQPAEAEQLLGPQQRDAEQAVGP